MLKTDKPLSDPQQSMTSHSGDTATNIDLKKIFQEYQTGVNRFPYDYFLSFLKQKQTNAAFLIEILQKMRPLVHTLEPKAFESTLITSLFFEIKWNLLHSRNSQLLAAFTDFLIDLNSAYTSYIYKCLTMLIKNFLICNSSEEPLVDCEALYRFSHNLIANLIRIAPVCKVHLLKQVDALYPYMTKDTQIQEAYILNVLAITEYASDLRLPLLETCIQKLLKVDVNCTREQIVDAELNSQTPPPVSDENQQTTVPTPAPNCMQLPLADRLDAMIEKLLQFIAKNCIKKTQDKEEAEDWEACKSIYKDLLFTFDKYVLCTYGSSHVQFLMFYMCSFKSMLSEGFIDYLWKKFSNPLSCQVTKQICTYYIGSFLARAKYININTCVATLTLIVTWLHGYIEKFSSNKNCANFEIHRTFYALCQTLFYVIIFRHKQLFNGQGNELTDLIKSWKLNEIVSSKLNPLRYCLPSVRKKFSRVSYINQIAYCYSIIDANNRVSLPTTSEAAMNKRMFYNNKLQNNDLHNAKAKNSSAFHENPLDSFFPFDPYLLKRSKPFIEKHYLEFQSVVDDAIDQESDSSDEEIDTDSDEEMSDEENSDSEDNKTQFDDDSDIDNSVDLKRF